MEKLSALLDYRSTGQGIQILATVAECIVVFNALHTSFGDGDVSFYALTIPSLCFKVLKNSSLT